MLAVVGDSNWSKRSIISSALRNSSRHWHAASWGIEWSRWANEVGSWGSLNVLNVLHLLEVLNWDRCQHWWLWENDAVLEDDTLGDRCANRLRQLVEWNQANGDSVATVEGVVLSALKLTLGDNGRWVVDWLGRCLSEVWNNSVLVWAWSTVSWNSVAWGLCTTLNLLLLEQASVEWYEWRGELWRGEDITLDALDGRVGKIARLVGSLPAASRAWWAAAVSLHDGEWVWSLVAVLSSVVRVVVGNVAESGETSTTAVGWGWAWWRGTSVLTIRASSWSLLKWGSTVMLVHRHVVNKVSGLANSNAVVAVGGSVVAVGGVVGAVKWRWRHLVTALFVRWYKVLLLLFLLALLENIRNC